MNRSTDKDVPYQGKTLFRNHTLHFTHLLFARQLDFSRVSNQEPMPPTSFTQATQDFKGPRRSSSSERDVQIGVSEIEPEKKEEPDDKINQNGLKDVVKEHASREGAKRAKATHVLAEVGTGLLTVLLS